MLCLHEVDFGVLKYLGIALLAILSAVFIFNVFIFFMLERHHKEACDRIETIAKNPSYVKYLDSWGSETFIGKGYYLVSGMNGDVVGYKSNKTIDSLNVPNQELSGIEEQYFRIEIEKFGEDFKSPITKENISKISIGRGRDSVIFLKNGHKISSHRGHDIESGHLMKINDSIYAYCANYRF